MKIAIVSHVRRDPAAGAATCTLSLANALRTSGQEVIEYFRGEYARAPLGKLEPDALAVTVLPLILRLRRTTDVVIMTGPLGWAASRLLNTMPVDDRMLRVALTYGLEHHDQAVMVSEAAAGKANIGKMARARWEVLVRPAVESSVRQADVFVALRERDREVAVRSGWKRYEQTFVMGLGVDDDVYEVAKHDASMWKNRIVWCGTTGARKGWQYFRDGFIRVASEIPNLCLDVIGSRRETSDILNEFPLSLAGSIRVHPVLPRREQFRIMANAGAFVSTSLSEGYHQAVQEAMSLGVPVVATAEGFIADIESSERPILEIPKHSAEAVAQAIRKMSLDGALRKRLSILGCEWGESRRWTTIGSATSRWLEEQVSLRGYAGLRGQ